MASFSVARVSLFKVFVLRDWMSDEAGNLAITAGTSSTRHV